MNHLPHIEWANSRFIVYICLQIQLTKLTYCLLLLSKKDTLIQIQTTGVITTFLGPCNITTRVYQISLDYCEHYNSCPYAATSALLLAIDFKCSLNLQIPYWLITFSNIWDSRWRTDYLQKDHTTVVCSLSMIDFVNAYDGPSYHYMTCALLYLVLFYFE